MQNYIRYIIKIFSLKPILFGMLCSFSQVHTEEIRLLHKGEVYYIPATLNDKIHLEFVIDSGAGIVYIPDYVFKKLKAAGSIHNSDILGQGKSKIANGTLVDTLFFNIRKLKIGKTILENIKGGVGSNGSSILLGQSALKKLEPWSIDTKRGVLKFGSRTKIFKNYVSSSKKINRGEVLGFINYYIALHNSRNENRIPSLYAPQVDYLNDGTLSRRKVVALKKAYLDSWQKIHISLLRLIETKEPALHPNQKIVKFSTAYKLYSDVEQKGQSGQLLYTLILEKSDSSIHIISEKEKILSKHNY
jgi:hypothetical protein